MTNSGSGGRDTRAPLVSPPPSPVLLALGSNVGDRRGHLQGALEFLSGRLDVRSVSRLVESAAWGPISQGPFLNLVVRADTFLWPFELLATVRDAEAAAGRTRGEWQGPRTLDVDILFHGDVRVELPELTLPHPRWSDRPFVSELVGEVAGAMVDPVSGRTLAELVPPSSLSRGLTEVEPLSWHRAQSGLRARHPAGGHPAGDAPAAPTAASDAERPR